MRVCGAVPHESIANLCVSLPILHGAYLFFVFFFAVFFLGAVFLAAGFFFAGALPFFFADFFGAAVLVAFLPARPRSFNAASSRFADSLAANASHLAAYFSHLSDISLANFAVFLDDAASFLADDLASLAPITRRSARRLRLSRGLFGIVTPLPSLFSFGHIYYTKPH